VQGDRELDQKLAQFLGKLQTLHWSMNGSIHLTVVASRIPFMSWQGCLMHV
jgi:hypothetical protein